MKKEIALIYKHRKKLISNKKYLTYGSGDPTYILIRQLAQNAPANGNVEMSIIFIDHAVWQFNYCDTSCNPDNFPNAKGYILQIIKDYKLT